MAFMTCEMKSDMLRMPSTVSLILPQDIYRDSEPPKVLYLLHGSSHNYSSWQRYTALERYAAQYNMAVIMPEANHSFYVDMRYGQEYYSYLTEELPALCESLFRIPSDAGKRYVAGMSMGGYGALKACLGRPGFYRACYAMSAVTDIRLHVRRISPAEPKSREFCAIFGPGELPSDGEDLFCLAAQAKEILGPQELPPIAFYCGRQDAIYPETEDFHAYLQSLSWPLKKEIWDGIHDWVFWDEAVRRVLKAIAEE